MEERIEIFNNAYLGLFNDGELGISDGVGYVDTLTKEQVKELYEALRKFFESEGDGRLGKMLETFGKMKDGE